MKYAQDRFRVIKNECEKAQPDINVIYAQVMNGLGYKLIDGKWRHIWMGGVPRAHED